MADETITTVSPEASTAEPAVLPAKKERAPRKAKGAVSATPAAGNAVKERKKPGPKPGHAKAIQTSTSKARAQREPKTVATAGDTSSGGVAELDELFQLEEENKRLRKALAEKLRAENAELRRRLGTA